MTDTPDPSDAEYGLVMPFVVCASQGGHPADEIAHEVGMYESWAEMVEPITERLAARQEGER